MPKSKSERKSREESSSDEENPRPPKRRSRTQPTKVNEQPKETSEKSQLFLLFFASLLIMAVMIEYCADSEKDYYSGRDKKCDLDDRRGFALAVGVISLAFTCFMLAMSFLASSVYETIAPIFAILLFVLWAPGAYLTTIKGPFSETPRSDAAEEFIAKRTGFLGMWAGFFLSFSILKSRLARAEISSMLGCTSCTVNVN
mmetsp:Transcript_5983/g.14509  ORF Transcript_5983/g.14509 Transcript_5983/m.14509 type:complete len:200 (-) Transcript_5983:448-1047(-)